MDTKKSVPFESIVEQAYHDLWDASKIAAHTTKCKRKGVACMLVPFVSRLDESLVDYHLRKVYTNGPLRDDEQFCSGEIGNCGCIHAEMNALVDRLLWTKGLNSPGYALFCNYSPCTNCANLIVKSTIIHRVVFIHDTVHDMRGIEVMSRSGIRTRKFSDYEV